MLPAALPKWLSSNWKRLALSASSLLVFLLVLEGAARILEPDAPGTAGAGNAMVIPDTILNHKWAPDLALRYPSHGFEYVLETNGQSWVEVDDIPIEKPADSYRIFFVGDSNVQGLVNRREKLVERIEVALGREYESSDLRIEVINTGTTSYSTLLYYLLVKTVLLQFEPDLVVINVDMTDVANDAHYRKLAIYDDQDLAAAVLPAKEADRNRYRLTPFGTVELTTAARWRSGWIERSAIARRIDDVAKRLRGTGKARHGLPKAKGHWLAHDWDKQTSENVAFSMRYLERTLALLAEHGVASYVTGVPHYPQFSGEWSARPHRALERAAVEAGALYLDSFEALEAEVASAGPSAYYWADDPTHFNVEGNRIWADAHLAFMRRNRAELLPPLD
jgi:lysophospholipase L1-like esterase